MVTHQRLRALLTFFLISAAWTPQAWSHGNHPAVRDDRQHLIAHLEHDMVSAPDPADLSASLKQPAIAPPHVPA